MRGQLPAENLWPWFTSTLFVIFAMQVGGWPIWKILFIVQKQSKNSLRELHEVSDPFVVGIE